MKVWNLTNADAPAVELKFEAENAPNDADWTADGKTLAVGCKNGEVLVYDDTGALRKTVPPLREEGKGPVQIARLRFLPGGKRVAFAGFGGWVGVIDLDTGQRPVAVREHTNTVMAVNHSADGELAVTVGGENNEIVVWEAKTGAVVRKIQSASSVLIGIGWARSGRSLAWGNTNKPGANRLAPLEQSLRLDDFQLGPPPRAGDYIRNVSGDGRYALRWDNLTEFTVSENDKPLYAHKARAGQISTLSLLPGKGVLVSAQGLLYMLDLKTGNVLRDFRGARGLTLELAPSPDCRYFVSSSTDQVVRVWSPEREEPVLSIFAVGREWIAWTPQGYYACSPFGERLIAWQVNNGIDRLPQVHPAARFRASLYQPALIKYQTQNRCAQPVPSLDMG